MGFDRFDPATFLAGLQKNEKSEAPPAKVAKAAKVSEADDLTLAGLATLAGGTFQNQKFRLGLPASLEAILARFPGSEIVSVTRYDVPGPSELEPLDTAGRESGVCAQCRDPDGQATRWLDRRRNVVVWLHSECRRHYWARKLPGRQID